MEKPGVQLESNISDHILFVRGQKVILDFDLASLYGVETKALKRAVRRNKDRFPDDFLFELTETELKNLRYQFGTSSQWGGPRYPPFAFTEQGVAMLSSILRSKRAIEVNIAIMRTFVKIRTLFESNKDLSEKLKELEIKYDQQFRVVFQAMRKLIKEESIPRTEIGFKVQKTH